MKDIILLGIIGVVAVLVIADNVVYGLRIDSTTYFQWKELVNYCFEHATDSADPIQDLADKGFLPEGYEGTTCAGLKENLDKYIDHMKGLLAPMIKIPKEQIDDRQLDIIICEQLNQGRFNTFSSKCV